MKKKWKATKYTRDIISRATMERQAQRERLWLLGELEEWRVEIPWCFQAEFDILSELAAKKE